MKRQKSKQHFAVLTKDIMLVSGLMQKSALKTGIILGVATIMARGNVMVSIHVKLQKSTMEVAVTRLDIIPRPPPIVT